VTGPMLVYRGPATCEGCPEALAGLLRTSQGKPDVRYVEGRELKSSPAALTQARLYAQGGGGASLRRAYRQMKPYAATIREYVRAGGRYLGICMGGYLAGHWQGFKLLPEDTDQYITSPGASVRHAKDTLVEVAWGTEHARMFFQDGPVFRIPPGPSRSLVLARYASNGEIAAMVTPYGKGWVGVCGPHPEAPQDWYVAHGLPPQQISSTRLGHALVDALMTAE
jgi:glutamine amidotransferase-like uncharacterized protein